MADKNPRPDWRNANKKPAGATPAAGAGKRDWQKQSLPTSGPRKPWSRGSKLFLAAALLAALFGGVFLVIPWLRPIGPACFVLMGASYDDNLAIPHNAYGWKNLDDLGNLTKDADLFTSNGRPTLLHRSPELKGARIWKDEWDKLALKIRNSREKTVVLFLALHGAADSKGAYLFLNDDQAEGHPPYARLPFDEVLKTLQGDDLRDKDILLVLEPALSRANWSAGVLENNFVASLPEAAKLKKNLFILCASDAQQMSWWSEEWQQTVFGHYVIEALRGAADGTVDGSRNSRVSVREIADYVKKKVGLWSQINRAAEQTPILIGDAARAEKIEIVQVGPTYQERDGDAPGLDFRIPEGLENAWLGWKSLRTMTPHPAVYSPALWRRYQDLLVRYEQLLRAGDPTKKAGDIASNLAGMKKKIESEARFDAADAALSLALAMPEALGVPLPAKLNAKELEARLQKVWEAKVDDRPVLLKESIEWAKSQADIKTAQLQVQAYRSLLDFVTESKFVREADVIGKQSEQDSRSKTAAILDQYDAQLVAPRPAEVHYLTMLIQEKMGVSRDPAPDFELLRKSLTIRRLAERAALAVPDEGKHPYSEILFPWNRDRLAKADALRRPGEDYLFGSNADDWEKGRRLLAQAETSYRDIQNDSQLYRRALDMRDTAYAALPYFALWVANQRVPGDEARANQIKAWGNEVEQFAERARSLQSELEKGIAGAPSANRLTEFLTPTEKSLKNLSESMFEEIRDAKSDAVTQSLWFNREALLSVPPLLTDAAGSDAVAVRLTMLTNNRFVSRELFQKTKDTAKFFGDKEKKDEAKILAERNAAMATAAFKGFWRNNFSKVEGAGTMALGEAIAEIAAKWPGDINGGLLQSVKDFDSAQSAAALARVDFLARGLPGGFDEKPEPVSVSNALRRFRMCELCVGQARRANLDHWFSEVDGKPYYEKAALGYLNVAKQIVEFKDVEAKDANRQRIARCDALIDAVKTVGLKIDGSTSDYWTSEKEFPVRWTVSAANDPYLVDPKIAAESKAPLAVAVAWRELDGAGAWKDGASPGQRRPLEFSGRKAESIEDVYYLTKTDNDALLKATYNVLLRGHLVPRKIEISQKNPDLIVHDFPKSTDAYMKVRMHPQFTYGAVSIAFDISGSMIWRNGYGIMVKGELKTRLELALVALRTTLDSIPDGTHVSLLAFVTYDGEKKATIVDVMKPEQWSRDKAAGLIRDIEKLADRAWPENKEGAQGGTPMAYLLKQCYEKGFPREGTEIRGPKVILALTDGDDTTSDEFVKGGWPNREVDQNGYNRKVRDFVRSQLSESDVEIHFVCFIDEENPKYKIEAANARAQFSGVEKEFKRPGQFRMRATPEDVADELQRAIRPRLIVMKNNKVPIGFPEEGIFASLPRDHKLIKIPEGNYQIFVKGSRERNMTINRGDILSIVLKRDPSDMRKVVYERELFADLVPETTKLLGDAPASLEPFRISVLQNKAENLGQRKLLTQLIAVEENSRNPAVVQQTVPPFTWIETKPKSTLTPQMMRWYREYGYPALTYRLLGYDWPAPAGVAVPSEMSVWLTDKPQSSVYSKQVFRSLKNEKAETIALDVKRFANIEYARIEEKLVVPDGYDNASAKPMLKQCLVVRVEHAKDCPVMIQYGGLHKGEEHHFFHSANKCTAIFWDLTDAEADSLSFNVIFLDKLKETVTPTIFPLSRPGSLTLQQQRMGN